MNHAIALVADIGGTHARFALADRQRRAPLLQDSIRQLAVSDFPSLIDAARHYLDETDSYHQAQHGVFAVAGRVEGDQAKITNHPWLISRQATAKALHLGDIQLINDFKAQALATEAFEPSDLVAIGGPAAFEIDPQTHTFAVLGPGTGLGVSAVVCRDGHSIALETEGGHVGFAPGNEQEARILQLLSTAFGRVSNERLLSGGGLSNIHRALAQLAGDRDPPLLAPKSITAGAATGDLLCQQSIEIFCQVFGAIAGDLVLTLGAWDGVYLTGGLVPKLLGHLQGSDFRQRFEAKGRFADSMARIPTWAVIHPQAGLLGAAAMAARRPSS